MDRESKAVVVGPVEASVDAAPGLVFQMLTAIGQGAQASGERAEILERHGDDLVADFWTTLRLPFGRRRLVRTRERVRVLHPDRVEYEHLDGPVRGLRESIVVEARPGGTSRLVYRGEYRPRGLAEELVFRTVSGWAVEQAVRVHFADLATRAAARQARSRVFGRPARDRTVPADTQG